MNAPLQLSRRDLLKGSGVLVVAFSIAPHLEALAQGAAATKSVSLDQVDTFLAIDGKGLPQHETPYWIKPLNAWAWQRTILRLMKVLSLRKRAAPGSPIRI